MEKLTPFILGGISSMAAECGTYPIDLTKTRLQLQGQQTDTVFRELRYRGMLHAFQRIVQEEGFKALYAGLSAGLLRQAVYGTLKMGMYKSWKADTLSWNMMCGATAGIIAATIACPTDVLKVRMQARGVEHLEKRRELGTVQLFFDTYQKEGIRGLWRGVGPTAQRAAIVAGVELAAYDFTKQRLLNSSLPFRFEDNKVTHVSASFIAGLCGALASNPIDVVRTRMMNQRRFRSSVLKTLPVGEAAAQRAIVYRNEFTCLFATVHSEGLLALYKGFMPNWLRLGPWNIIFFVTYEHLSRTGSTQLTGW